MIQAPCKNCPDKGCGPKHNTCQAYQTYRAEIDKMTAAKRDCMEDAGNKYNADLGRHKADYVAKKYRRGWK